jgi:Uri superfamily endonuclease
LRVGSLGEHRYPNGYFLYIGSAKGPGGLRARVQRHLRPDCQKRHHWHIDRLSAIAKIKQIWWYLGTHAIECKWAKCLEETGLRMPPKFGASDCRCQGHLIQVDTVEKVETAYRLSQKMMDEEFVSIELKKVELIEQEGLDVVQNNNQFG